MVAGSRTFQSVSVYQVGLMINPSSRSLKFGTVWVLSLLRLLWGAIIIAFPANYRLGLPLLPGGCHGSPFAKPMSEVGRAQSIYWCFVDSLVDVGPDSHAFSCVEPFISA